MDSAGQCGIVRPIADVQHLVLFIEPSSGGTFQAFIHNPEENAGARLGRRTVSLAGDVIRLQRSGSPDITGVRSTRDGTITLQQPGLPGTFVFHRDRNVAPARPYVYEPPRAGSDGWATGTLSANGIDTAAVTRIIRGIQATRPGRRSPDIQSLSIVRHGTLVLDSYFDGFNRNRPHDVRSAGKSVTTLLVGRAIHDTHAFGPATLVGSLLTRYRPFAHDDARKQHITVGNLMSMSAGYACDDNDDASPGNEDLMQAQTAEPDWYKFTLDLPMRFAPGTNAAYCSAEINLLGAIITTATRRRLTEYFYERFAEPMQFGSYGLWLSSPPPDTAYMAGGDYFLPRDFLKFGQLFLSNGRWHGRHVVDPSWLALSAAKHSYIRDAGGDYGYGWHLLTYRINGHAVRAINAGGNGGQLLFVFPQLDMLVMITAGNYGQYPVWARFQHDLVPQLLRAVDSLAP